MKIDTPPVLFRNYYGANPELIYQAYIADPGAPHANTDRITYVVPANKRLLLNVINISLMRSVPATTAGRVRVSVWIVMGPTRPYTELSFIDNSVGIPRLHTSTPQLLISSGDTVLVQTMDLSTGGNVIYNVSLGGILIDY